VLGKILFAMTCGHFDISYAVSKLSQFSNNPAAVHYRALQKATQYLIRTKAKGLIYWRKSPRHDLPEVQFDLKSPDASHSSQPWDTTHDVQAMHIKGETTTGPVDPRYSTTSLDATTLSDIAETLMAMTDSDYAADARHRRSISGSAVLLFGAVIDFKTRVQPTVSLSSCEAELIALCGTAKRVKHIRNILKGIGIKQLKATPIYCDNEGAKKVATATGTTKRLRHVDIQYFAVQQWQRNEELEVMKIHTTVNAADLMTKGLQKKLHERHTDRMMGYYGPSLPRVCVGIRSGGPERVGV
jgi:hypothetical protein